MNLALVDGEPQAVPAVLVIRMKRNEPAP